MTHSKTPSPKNQSGFDKEVQIKISVVTVARNCVGTVAGCLASVAAQTYADREHVVVDGASRDGTLEVLQAHRAQLTVLLSEPDAGIYDAMNKGIALSSGDVVGFLNADDVYADPNVLAQMAIAFADPSVCAVYGDLQYVAHDDPSHIVRRWKSGLFSKRRLGWGWMPPHPTFYVRREWYQRIGGFDTRYRISGDYHSILRMFSHPGFKVSYLPKVLVKMRMGGVSNRSLPSMLRKSREDLDALQRTGLGGWGALSLKSMLKLGQFL